MIRYLHKSVFLQGVLLASLNLFISPQSHASDSISLSVDERFPYHYTNSNGLFDGVAYQVVKCGMTAIDQEFKLDILPWKRAQHNVENGLSDGFFAASHNLARDKYARLSSVIIDQYWNWYFKKENTIDDSQLTPKNVGKVASWLGSNSQKWLIDNDFTPAPPASSAEVLLSLLLNNHLNSAFGSSVLFDSAIEKQAAVDKVKVIKGPHKPMGIYFSHDFLGDNQNFLEKFNTAVDHCRNTIQN